MSDTNPTTQSIADYLAQLLKDKKQLAAFPNVFIHVERLLDEGKKKTCYLRTLYLRWSLVFPETFTHAWKIAVRLPAAFLVKEMTGVAQGLTFWDVGIGSQCHCGWILVVGWFFSDGREASSEFWRSPACLASLHVPYHSTFWIRDAFVDLQ